MLKVSHVHNAPNIVAHIIMGTDCNLRCEYCYEPKKEVVVMTKTQLEYAINFYFDFAKANNRNFITFIFFGGEPFLHMDLMRHGIDYALEKKKEYKGINIEFATDTNGMIWNDEVKEFILDWYKKSG